MSEVKEKLNDVPPNAQIRNEFGLIKGLNYIFTEDGSRVDWRKMLDSKYLVPNRQNFIKKEQNVPNSIDGLEDKDLVVLLQGFRTIADIRGYTDVNFDIITSSPNFCSIKCTIKWIPNFETQMKEINYSSTADAHYDSVDGIFRNYLTAMAENRAFQRCIRNYLKIGICAKDEIGPIKEESISEIINLNSQVEILENLLKSRNITFEQFKKKLINDKIENAEKMTTLNDLSKDKIFEYIERIKKSNEKEK